MIFLQVWKTRLPFPLSNRFRRSRTTSSRRSARSTRMLKLFLFRKSIRTKVLGPTYNLGSKLRLEDTTGGYTTSEERFVSSSNCRFWLTSQERASLVYMLQEIKEEIRHFRKCLDICRIYTSALAFTGTLGISGNAIISLSVRTLWSPN